MTLRDADHTHVLRCDFSGVGSTVATLISATSAQCHAPASLRAGSFQSVLSVLLVQDSPKALASFVVDIIEPIKITALSPKLGLVSGGYNVMLSTQPLHSLQQSSMNQMQCAFGRVRVKANFVNATAISCEVPAVTQPVSAPVSVLLRHSEFDGGSSTYFTYIKQVRLNAVTPASAPVTGNTSVIVETDDQVHPGINCAFGSAVVPATVVSGKKLRCVSPAFPEETLLYLQLTVGVMEISENALMMEIFSIPDTFAILSPHAVIHENSTIVVSGSKFTAFAAVNCVFQTDSGTPFLVVPATVVSGTRVECSVPHFSLTSTQVALSVVVDGITAIKGESFRYMKELRVLAVAPMMGFASGGTTVNFTVDTLGSEAGAYTCMFGNVVVPATLAANTSVVSCSSPPRNSTQDAYLVRVSANGIDYFASLKEDEQVFRYLPEPLVSNDDDETLPSIIVGENCSIISASCNDPEGNHSITDPIELFEAAPRLFPCAKRAIIEVSGQGFESGTSLECLFDGVGVPAAYIDSTRTTCQSPSFEQASFVRLRLSSLGGHVTEQSVVLQCIPEPTLTSVTPSTPLIIHDTVSAINVSHSSVSEELEVRCCINSTICSSGARRLSTLTQCAASPFLHPGRSMLHLRFGSTSIGFVDSTHTSLRFVAPPIVTNVVPRRQFHTPDAVISLLGTNFENSSQLSCLFRFQSREQTALALWRTSTMIVCVVSKSDFRLTAPEEAELLVRTVSSEHVSTGFNITFFPEPEVRDVALLSHHIAPSEEQVAALSGFDFDPRVNYFCRFSFESKAVSIEARWLNASKLACSIPSWNAGKRVVVDVWTELNGAVDRAVPSLSLDIPARVAPWSITPSHGSVVGGTVLEILLHNDDGEVLRGGSWRCCFSQIRCSRVEFRAASGFTCESPSAPGPGVVPVELVDEYGSKLYWLTNWFYYSITPKILSVYPTRCMASGGDQITIRGFGFSSMQAFKCRFGSSLVDAAVAFDNKLYCVAPPHDTQATTSVPFDVLGVGSYRTELVIVSSDFPIDFIYLVEPEVQSSMTSLPPPDSEGDALADVKPLVQDSDFADFGSIDAAEAEIDAISTTEVNLQAQGISFPDDQPAADFIDTNSSACDAGTNLTKLDRIAVSNDLARTHATGLISSQPFEECPAKASASFLLQVTKVSQEFGFASGGSLIKIEGSGFLRGSYPLCHFGPKHVVKGYASSKTVVFCVSPAVTLHTSAQEVEFWLSDDDDAISKSRTFTFYTSPRVRAIRPTFGPSTGGTIVVVFGENFSPRFTFECVFGEKMKVPALAKNSTTLFCKSPPLVLGNYSLGVLLNGVDKVSNEFAIFSTVPKEILARINPARGLSSHGGEAKAIVYGSNFVDSSELRCKFDEVLSAATFLSTWAVECTVPRMPAGVKSVRVANNGADFAASVTPGACAYEVVPHFAIDHIAPKSGLISGGTVVQVVGVFSRLHELECVFGEERTVVKAANGSVLTCVAPSTRVAGNVDVSVRLGNSFAQSRDDGSNVFTYLASPRVSRISPSVVSQTVRLVPVTIHGEAFDSVEISNCRFSRFVGEAINKSASSITCLLNASLTGEFDVALQTPSSLWVHIPTHQRVHIVRAPQLRRVHPSKLDERGGLQVIVTASNLHPAALTAKCRFGDHIVEGMIMSDTSMRCVSPPQVPGITMLQISQDGISWSEAGLDVLVFASPVLSQVEPERVIASLSTDITITGTNLRQFAETSCRFDSIEVPAVSVNGTAIACRTPVMSAANTVVLRVTLNGVEVSSNGLRLEFDAPLPLLSMSPGIESQSTPARSLVWRSTAVGYDDNGCILEDRARDSLVVRSNRSVARSLKSDPGEDDRLDTSVAVTKVNATVETYHAGSATSALSTSAQLSLPESRPAAKRQPVLPAAHLSSPKLDQVRVSQDLSGANGSLIVLTGHNFAEFDAMVCEFDFLYTQGIAFEPKWRSEVVANREQEGTCRAPPAMPTSVLVVRLTLPQLELSSNAVHFDHLSSFDVESTSPNSGPAHGGYRLVVYGRSFPDVWPVWCGFADRETRGKRVSSFEIQCLVPPAGVQRSVSVSLRFGGTQRAVSTNQTFTYDVHATIRQIRPSIGWNRGGTRVTVDGSGLAFGSSTRCMFGDIASVATFVSPSQLVCESPAVISSRRVSFSVVSDRVALPSSTKLTFEYVALAVVQSLAPMIGPHAGGSEVVLNGSFGALLRVPDQLFCAFGENGYTSAKVASKSIVRCTSPPHHTQLAAPLGLFYHTGDIALTGFQFRYAVTAQFTAASPLRVQERWSGFISVFGANFFQSVSGFCVIGKNSSATRSALRFRSPQHIECAFPSLPPGRHRIHVSLNGEVAASTGLTLTVAKFPVVYTMTPSADFSAGGATVEFVGANFEFVHPLSCLFGSMSSRARFEDGKIVCTAPSASLPFAARQRVNVSLVGQGVAPYTHQTFPFEYVASPLVTSLDTAWIQLKAALLLCGEFPAEVPLFAKLASSHEKAYSTQSTSGAVWNVSCWSFDIQDVGESCSSRACGVFLSVNDQTFAFTGKRVRLGSMPVVTHIQPRYSGSRGGDVVQVLGRNLYSAMSRLVCRFGQAASAKEVVRSATRVDCVAPSHHAGRVNLTILQASISGEAAAATPIAVFEFDFIEPMEVDRISPTFGSPRGGAKVAVTGKGFTAHSDLVCVFGMLGAPAFFVNSSHVICVSPPQLSQPDVIPISVALGSTRASSVSFRYLDMPSVEAIEPCSGIYNKSHAIQVRGRGFDAAMDFVCQFGGTDHRGTFISTSLVECPLRVTPTRTGTWPSVRLPLRLSVNGADYFDSGFSFLLLQPAVIASVTPDVVLPAVTTNITLVFAHLALSRELECYFAELNRSSVARVIGDRRVTCDLPTSGRLHPGLLHVELLRNGTQHSAKPFTVDVIRTPEVFDLFPQTGSAKSLLQRVSNPTSNLPNVLVTDVMGKNFPPFRDILCRFGPLLSSGTYMSANRVRCVVPESPVAQAVTVSLSFNAWDFVESRGVFTFLSNMYIRQVVPWNGEISGGTRVRIRGGVFDLSDTITCHFGSAASVAAVVVSAREIVCITPRMKATGLVDVAVRSAGLRVSGVLRNGFLATKRSAVTTVWPLAAFEKRETHFDIYGTGFLRSPALSCAFQNVRPDGEPTQLVTGTVIWRAATHIKCVSPATITAWRTVRIGVTNNGQDFTFASADQAIAFVTLFDVTRVFPPFGRSDGDTAVTITGKDFDLSQRVWCRFGDMPRLAVGEFLSANELVCHAPRFRASIYMPTSKSSTTLAVALSVNSKDFEPSGHTYTYTEAPQVLAIQPTRGTVEGSTLVHVTGAHFVAGMAWCRFGRVEVRAMVSSATELVCISPPSSFAEEVAVDVSMNGGVDFTASAVLYTYHLPPQIRRVTPTLGPASGGTQLTIRGANFYNSKHIRCCFADRHHCSRGFLTARYQVRCTTPPSPATVMGPAGSLIVTLMVTFNGEDFFTPRAQFEYVLPPIVEGVFPRVADSKGGTVVHITGRNFRYTTALACRFGAILAHATYVNESSVSCEAPVHVPGTSTLSVSLNGQNFAAPELDFAFIVVPTLLSVSSSIAPPSSANRTLRVLGSDFSGNATRLSCELQHSDGWTVVSDARYVSRTKVDCDAAAVVRPGSIRVRVLADGIAAASGDAMNFTLLNEPLVESVEPSLGIVHGGTKLIVLGSRFESEFALHCCFEQRTSNFSKCKRAQFVSDKEVRCVSPAFPQAGVALLGVHSSNQAAASDTVEFQVHSPITLTSVSPSRGTIRGGTNVRVAGWKFIFTPHLSCCFDSTRMPATFVNDSVLECRAPYLGGARSVSIRVSYNGRDCYNSGPPLVYTFDLLISVKRMSPAVGSQLGGTMVTMEGTNFVQDSSACFFGDRRASVSRVISSSRMECQSPPQLAAKRERVAVSNNGADFSFDATFFTYLDAESVLGVFPHRVASRRSGMVTLTVANIVNVASLSCFFDDVRVSAIFRFSNKVQCAVPRLGPGHKKVYVSNDGIMKSRNFAELEVVNPPVIVSTQPAEGSLAGGAVVKIEGSRLDIVSHCRFGDFEVVARLVNPSRVECISPPRVAAGEVSLQLVSYGADLLDDLLIFKYTSAGVAVDIGVVPMPLVDEMPPTAPSSEKIDIRSEIAAYVHAISPTHGPHTGGTLVTVYGRHFSHSSRLQCRFGDATTRVVKFVSATEVSCLSPAKMSSASVVLVTVTTDNATYTPNPVFFTYTTVGNVVSVTPQFGPTSGGTILHVRAFNLEISDSGKVYCLIAAQVIVAELLTPTFVRCVTPRVNQPGVYAVNVSTNGHDFTPSGVLFEFTAELVIERISPELGPSLDANTVVTAFGSGFLNTPELSCFFDSVRTPATWQSSVEVSCATPSQLPHVATVRVSNNGLDKSKSSARFLFHKDVALSRITPTKGLIEGRTPVFLKGRNFLNHTLMSCRFGARVVAAQFLSASMLVCVPPRQLTNLMSTGGRVSVEVSSNRVDFTNSGLEYTYFQRCPVSQYCSNANILPCPNGTTCEAHGSGNFSLCSPGSFQPRQAQTACLMCPVGFYCPDFGHAKPVLCRPGMVCDAHGLRVPVKSCPSGHYCRKGTKTANISDFSTNPEYAIDKETQLATFLDMRRAWAFIARVAPAIGSRRIEHPPSESSCDSRLCVEDSAVLLAERPYSCPVGTFCKRGVAVQQLEAKNFSTPQKCFPGFFCPRGSSTPEGQGPCPTGHYCPTDVDAVVCPAGQYCPGVGNIRPRDCYPGTYNPVPKQSNCTLCPTGHVCPQWKMLAPVLCPAGFVCISTGLSSPVLLCPPGYICALGTRTLDPSDIIPFRPMPCPKGTYCLGGVAHNITTEWLPNQEAGAVAPQTCTEGTYCKEATRSMSGTAPCYSGHYCPPGASTPTQAPVGSFSASTGTVAATLCFPGTYTPLKGTAACEICPAGHSCPGYGTYIPSLCPKGFYRSLADSITCRPCPEGTWTRSTGVTDISLCEICPAGRVCGSSSMSTLASSLPCAAGYVCGEGTNRRSQFDHLCPGGHYCYAATTIDKQYANVCEKGYTCARGTKNQEKNKNKCLDGKFCPLGTANATSVYTQCPKNTWTGSGQDELLDCVIRPVPICDKSPEKQYYPTFSYSFQGSSISFDSTVETDRTGEVEVVQVVYPVNESASVPAWTNDTLDAIRTCPEVGAVAGGALLTIIGRNFQDTNRLACSFQIRDYGYALTSPAFFVNSTRVRCRVPPYEGDASAVDFAQSVDVRVSNYGVFYSTTAATYTFVTDAAMKNMDVQAELATCLARRDAEEGFRVDDKAWFAVRGLSKAKLSFDFRHIPPDMVYGEHYRVALFVKNSVCEYQSCDARRVLKPSGTDIETTPCKLPVELPKWFTSTAVDKHDVLNITLLALEDVIVKVEVHIMYGLYAPAASFFVNSTTVQIKSPVRSNVTQGVDADTRPLSRTISYEEALVPRDYTFVAVYFGGDGDYTSSPLNLPPKYKDFERGRVLLSHNVSNASAHVPLIVDAYEDVNPGTAYWVMPYGSADLTHEMVLKYRETFHEMHVDPSDPTQTQFLFQFDKLLLPYLPFFSNCMEYDSYIPTFDLFESDACQLPELTSEQESYGRNWWRRKFPPLPNQDDIRYVGPLDVGAEPTADMCMLDVQCHYEEDLATADVTPRWFEQTKDTALFYLLREPATMDNYFRGGAYYDELYDSLGSDYFIPVTVDNTAVSRLEGDCSSLCFPRSVTLDVSYYQLDNNLKRIIKAVLVLADYDRDADTTGYKFSVNLHPLDYYQLIIQFAFERQVYILLFFVLGGVMTAAAFVFWFVVRVTTFLESPPRFRFYAVFALIAPPPSVGVALASLPILTVVGCFYTLLSGDKYIATAGASGYWLLDNIYKHYLDSKLEPDEVVATRKGRVGFAFLAFSLYLIILGTKVFLPKPIAISEKLIAEKHDDDARERSIWWPTQWKRANMMLTSILLGLFLCLMLEFSFWSSFGDYMFYVIVLTEVVNARVEGWIEGQLREALLIAPLVSALSLVGGLMTFGATDFGDFVMGNTLDFGMMLLTRVYADTAFEAIGEFLSLIFTYCFQKLKGAATVLLVLFRSFSRSTVASSATTGEVGAAEDDEAAVAKKKKQEEKKADEGKEDGATVEPIIDFYSGASMDRLALFYQPILILLMMFFREELMLPIIYNIREKDMEIYLWYSLIILFFQLVTEVFVLHVVELFQGWKLYDYLVYCRYRFLQREQRWKGLEPNLDECIDENLRTLDQMCFSSQFFMMCTVHITGVVFFVVAIEIMARAEYNLFGDPAMPILLAFVLCCAMLVRRVALFLAVKLEFWKIKHENTAWLAPPDDDDELGVPRWDELEKIKGASHEAYLMNQRITSETFRMKFLNYNRSWIVTQLPSVLTPRTLRRARPYLLAQFAKILDSLNPQISDDDEDHDGDGRPRFGPVTLSAPSRTIIRLWLARARRIQRLKAAVQPLIHQARKSECEMCLSRRQLQVELAIPIEVLGDKFESVSLTEEFDVAGWKEFFAKHEKFKTLCLNCVVHLKTTAAAGKRPGGDGGDPFGDDGPGWGSVQLNAASYALMHKWYKKAQDRVFGKHGRRRDRIDVSDDEEEALARHFEWTKKSVALNAASTALARKWLMTARQSLRESGRSRTTLPENLTAIRPALRGATPIPKPEMKMGAAGGDVLKMSKMRRK